MVGDVFQASRLPFDPGSPLACCALLARASSYVEECWSPSLAAPEKLQAKAHANSRSQFRARSAEGLSLSGGASIRTYFSQAGHHLSSSSGTGSPWSTKKATRWVALDWPGMRARDLARTPPSEGVSVIAPRRHGDAVRARLPLGGQGRFGE